VKRASAPSKREGASPAPTDKISIPPPPRLCPKQISPPEGGEIIPAPPRLRPEQISPPEGGEITPTAAIALGADLPAGRRGDHNPRTAAIAAVRGIQVRRALRRACWTRARGHGEPSNTAAGDLRVFYPMRSGRGCPRPADRDRLRAQAQIKERGRKSW